MRDDPALNKQRLRLGSLPMLGRTAQNLFWLSRYIERAENMARMFEVGYRMSLTSRREGSASEHLISMMQAAEVAHARKRLRNCFRYKKPGEDSGAFSLYTAYFLHLLGIVHNF
mgnify:CR=1 FL=1